MFKTKGTTTKIAGVSLSLLLLMQLKQNNTDCKVYNQFIASRLKVQINT